MSKQEIIYACPHGCKANLTCECEVKQTWYVDAKGNPVEVESSDEPDFFYETPKWRPPKILCNRRTSTV